MSMNIQERKLYFCFCLPHQYEDIERLNRGDFVRSRMALMRTTDIKEFWKKYSEEIVIPFYELKKQFDGKGVTFLTNFSSYEVGDLLRESDSIIIILSHCAKNNCEDEEIEFFDSMISSNALSKDITNSFKGILDLSVCEPKTLAKLLDIPSRPFVVLYWNCKINIGPMLTFYYNVFDYMQKSKCTYITAYKTIMKQII